MLLFSGAIAWRNLQGALVGSSQQVLVFAQRHRLEAHMVSGCEQRSSFPPAIPQRNRRPADKVPAAGRVHRIDTRHGPCDPDGASWDFWSGPLAPRQSEFGWHIAEIGEARQKPEHVD